MWKDRTIKVTLSLTRGYDNGSDSRFRCEALLDVKATGRH